MMRTDFCALGQRVMRSSRFYEGDAEQGAEQWTTFCRAFLQPDPAALVMPSSGHAHVQSPYCITCVESCRLLRGVGLPRPSLSSLFL